MAPVQPALACQGRTDHPAQLLRLALAGVVGGPVTAGATALAGGVNMMLGQALNVSGNASMTVAVGTGLVYMPNSTAWGGVYAGYNTAAYTVTVPASSSTQWRRDYIAAVMTDPGDNTAAWDIIDVAGTFSSSAPGALPTLPANAIPLAIINVVPNMTVTNGGGTVNDARVWQPLQGPVPCTSTTRPSSPPDGTMWYETDTDQLGIMANGSHKYIPLFYNGGSGIDPWHTITLDSGWSVPASRFAPAYRLVGDGTNMQLRGSAQRSGIAGSANLNNSNPLPAAYRPTNGADFKTYDTNFNRAHMSINSSGVITASSIGTVTGTWFGELESTFISLS